MVHFQRWVSKLVLLLEYLWSTKSWITLEPLFGQMSCKFIWLVPGSLDKCHGTHMKLFPENIICSLYQVLKRIWNFSSNGSQVYFIKVSLVQLVVCLKGLACLYILFLSNLASLKDNNFLEAAVQNLKLSAFQTCQNHSKPVDFWYAVYMQFICSLYAVSKTTCSLAKTAYKLHVVLKLHINCI